MTVQAEQAYAADTPDAGLASLECGQPLPICLPRAQGFDMGLVAVLEKPEHVASYAVHPAHLEYVLHLLIWSSQRLESLRCHQILIHHTEFIR